MRQVFDLLSKLNEAIPSENCNNNITLRDGKLVVTIFKNNKWYSFTLDEEDWDREDMADRMVEMLP